MRFFKTERGLVIRHQTITFAQKQLFCYDGTHLNELGNSALLNSLQGFLNPFCAHQQGLLFSHSFNIVSCVHSCKSVLMIERLVW